MSDETEADHGRINTIDGEQGTTRDTRGDSDAISVFDNLEVPRVLRMRLIVRSSLVALAVFGAVVFVIAWLNTHFELVSIHNVDDASTFLHTNIEILVTIFAVTLGVTLLGLQFRAQSYSIQAMIKYIRNRVVYGLIIIFTSLIGTNMVFLFIFDSMQEFESDHGFQIMALMMGSTIFSLYYLAGYVFFMVEGTQLRRVLEVIEKDLDDTVADKLNGKHEDEELEPFQIWEQVALRAVADDNTYAFRQSVNVMSGLYDRFLAGGDTRVLEGSNGFLKTAMLRCAKADRPQMAKYFLKEFMGKAGPAANRSGIHKETGTNIVDIWIQMMREAIIYDNDKVLDHCAKYLGEAMQINMKNCMDDIGRDEVADFFHAQFASLVGLAVSNDHHAYNRRYLDFVFSEFEHIAGYHRLYIYAVGNWETIMSHSIDAHNYKVFEIGMTRMAYYVDDVMDKEGVDREIVLGASNKAILRLAEKLCSRWDRRYVEAFLRKYPSWRKDKGDRPDRAWRYIMAEAIRRGDAEAFYYGLDRIEGYADSERDLGSVENFYPVVSRYESSDNLGIIEDAGRTKSGILDEGTLKYLRVDLGKDLERHAHGTADDRKPLIEAFMEKTETL